MDFLNAMHRPWTPCRRLPLVSALAAACLLAIPGATHAQVSLVTVVDLAQRNSAQVREAQADVLKARAALSESRDAVIPSLTFSTGLPAFPEVGFTGSPPSIWTATVQSLVFSIPQKRYIDAARMGLGAATANLKDASERVALDASVDYLELAAVDNELASAHEQDQYAARLVSIEEQRAEAGIDPLGSLLEARLTAAQIRLARIRLEARAGTLAAQLSALTGLPADTIHPEPKSIPEIPKLTGETHAADGPIGIQAAKLAAQSKFLVAKGDEEINYLPQLSFFAQYNRNTTLLNDVNSFFARPLPANNFGSGVAIQIPLFDMGHRAKARESAADALRARVEAEDAQQKNDVVIAQLNGTLRELDAMAEVASLKQQIATEQLKTVRTQLEFGSGESSGNGVTPQLSPKAEQLAEIDAGQKLQDSLDAGFQLARARLNLLEALGHMQDWLNELHGK
ncbi:MAG TPA: TolC family protein [Terracidiphilus sp.]|nr:TolC family protein [Terracidiphilus sp.]